MVNSRRFFITALIAVLVILGGINLLLLRSRYIYQQGVEYAGNKAWDKALSRFEAAEDGIPALAGQYWAQHDRFNIHTQKGIAYNEKALGMLEDNGLSIWVLGVYRKSRAELFKALAIGPNEYTPAYWLARSEDSLEMIYPKLFPNRQNAYDAGPYYRHALSLRPNGITAHYSYARYLARKHDEKGLAGVIARMTEIFPDVYHKLVREPFYSHTLDDSLEQGLIQALENNTLPRQAHLALSAFYKDKKLIDRAITHYGNAMNLRAYLNDSGNYVNMGALLLVYGDGRAAGDWFLKGLLNSDQFDHTLEQIFYIHRRESRFDLFLKLCGQLGGKLNNLPESVDIHVAKAWIEAENYPLARSRLLRLISKRPSAQAYYHLAKMDRVDEDWVQMELNAQRATVLAPGNSEYYYLFSLALYHQGKYSASEKAATGAILSDKKKESRFLNHRAWVRWAQQKYDLAFIDWETAFFLEPERSDYPYFMARACERSGLIQEGIIHINKALEIGSRDAMEKYAKLKARLLKLL